MLLGNFRGHFRTPCSPPKVGSKDHSAHNIHQLIFSAGTLLNIEIKAQLYMNMFTLTSIYHRILSSLLASLERAANFRSFLPLSPCGKTINQMTPPSPSSSQEDPPHPPPPPLPLSLRIQSWGFLRRGGVFLLHRRERAFSVLNHRPPFLSFPLRP